MSKDDELRTRYALAATAHGSATDRGDYKAANAAHDAVMAAVRALRDLPDRGRVELTALLDDSDAHVRCWAATHLLPIDQSRAVGTLSKLKSEGGFVSINAETVLREWNAGRLDVP